jgi:hypothetical protein
MVLAAGGKAVRFEGHFAETPKLQPAELCECESWQVAWLANDDKTVRPFPGNENENRKECEQMAKTSHSLVFLREAEPKPAATLYTIESNPGATREKKPWWKFL